MRRWLNHPIHVSWRITCYAAGAVGGVVLSPRLPVAYAEVLWALVLLCICLATFRWRYRWCCTLWLLAGLALGAWRGTSELRALTVYRTYYGAALQVSGVLRDDASFGRQGDQRFELQSVRLRGGTALAGRVWVSSAQGADIKRGD